MAQHLLGSHANGLSFFADGCTAAMLYLPPEHQVSLPLELAVVSAPAQQQQPEPTISVLQSAIQHILSLSATFRRFSPPVQWHYQQGVDAVVEAVLSLPEGSTNVQMTLRVAAPSLPVTMLDAGRQGVWQTPVVPTTPQPRSIFLRGYGILKVRTVPVVAMHALASGLVRRGAELQDTVAVCVHQLMCCYEQLQRMQARMWDALLSAPTPPNECPLLCKLAIEQWRHLYRGAAQEAVRVADLLERVYSGREDPAVLQQHAVVKAAHECVVRMIPGLRSLLYSSINTIT